MGSPDCSEHVVSLELSDSQLFRFEGLFLKVRFVKYVLLELQDSFVDLGLEMEGVRRNVVG